MDKHTYKEFEKEISTFANIIEANSNEVDNEYTWFIELIEYGVLGFISIENNEEDISNQTITFSLLLYDVTNVSKEGLLKLFSLNGDFHGCSLSTELIEDRWKLFINRRIFFNSNREGELDLNINLMLNRLEVFQGTIEQLIQDNKV